MKMVTIYVMGYHPLGFYMLQVEGLVGQTLYGLWKMDVPKDLMLGEFDVEDLQLTGAGQLNRMKEGDLAIGSHMNKNSGIDLYRCQDFYSMLKRQEDDVRFRIEMYDYEVSIRGRERDDFTDSVSVGESEGSSDEYIEGDQAGAEEA